MDLNEARQILNKNGLNLVDSYLTESSGKEYYTGLLDGKGIYASIIHSALGQILDGIGEGDGRTSAIFRYYFKELVGQIKTQKVNDELVINCAPYYLEQLIKLIWRVAAIERQDNGSDDRNIEYDYLRGASWYDICKLQNALKKIVDNHYQTEPMTEEDKQKKLDRIEKYKQKAEQKAKEEAEKAAQKKQDELNDKLNQLESVFDGVIPDSKDEQRAEDAWNRYSKDLNDFFYKGLVAQLKKIKENDKKKRRITAFYNKSKEQLEPESFIKCLGDRFANLAKDPDYYS